MSRVLAVLVFMILIGLGGGLLDRALGTSIWTLVGFVLGIAFAMVGMWYVVKVAEYESRQGDHRQEGDRIAGLDEEGMQDRKLGGESLEERNE